MPLFFVKQRDKLPSRNDDVAYADNARLESGRNLCLSDHGCNVLPVQAITRAWTMCQHDG